MAVSCAKRGSSLFLLFRTPRDLCWKSGGLWCSVFQFFGIKSQFLFLTGLIIIMNSPEFVHNSQLLWNSSSDFKFLQCQTSILLMQFACFIKGVKKEGIFFHSFAAFPVREKILWDKGFSVQTLTALPGSLSRKKKVPCLCWFGRF